MGQFGGLAGGVYGGGGTFLIEHSSSSANVVGPNGGTGGILGNCTITCAVNDTFSTGQISGNLLVGGIVGATSYGPSQPQPFLTITNSYSAGAISAEGDGGAGGILGGRTAWGGQPATAVSSITSSFALGNVVCSGGSFHGMDCGAISAESYATLSSTYFYAGATYTNSGSANLNLTLTGMTSVGSLAYFFDPSSTHDRSLGFYNDLVEQSRLKRLAHSAINNVNHDNFVW